MSAALVFLHHEAFDLSRTRVSENDQDDAPVELAKDVESSVAVRSDVETQTDDIPIQSESEHIQNDDLRSQHETLGEVAEMEIDGQNIEVADAANHSVNGLEPSSQTNPVSNDFAKDMPEDIVQRDLLDKNNVDSSVPVDTACMSPQKFDTEPVEDASLADISNGRVDAIEDIGHDAEKSVDPEKDNDNLHASIGVASVETGGDDIMTSGNGDQIVEGNGNNDLSIVNPDELQGPDLGCEDKDLVSGCMQAEGAKVDSSLSLQLDGDVGNAPLNRGENAEFQEIDPQSAMNAAITAESSAIEFRGVCYHLPCLRFLTSICA